MKKYAKKWLSLFLVGIMAFTMAGCSTSGSSASSAPSNTPSETSAQAPKIDYPKYDITAVCQFGAGGGNDIQMRAIAPYLKKYLPNNVNVVVDNRTGGGGIVATNYVWSAKPDGYTLLQGQIGNMLVQQLTSEEIQFKNHEFRWLGIYSIDNLVVVLRPDINVSTWDQLVDYANNNTLKIGTAGAGSNTHMQAAFFLSATGLKGQLVHYADGTPGVIGGFGRGEIDMYIFSIGSQSISAVSNGTVKNFCVISNDTNEFLTEVPTVAEIGMPVEMVNDVLACPLIGAPRGIAAPPNTPDEIIAILDEAIQKVFADPELVDWAKQNMLNWTPMNADESQQWVVQGLDKLAAYSDMLKEVVG